MTRTGNPAKPNAATARLLIDAKSVIYELLYQAVDDGRGTGVVIGRDVAVERAQGVYERIEKALTGVFVASSYAPAPQAATRTVQPSPGAPAVPGPGLEAMLEQAAAQLRAEAAELAAETRRVQTAKRVFGADLGAQQAAAVESSVARSGTELARLLTGVRAALYALLHGTIEDDGLIPVDPVPLEPGAIAALGHEAHSRVRQVLESAADRAPLLLMKESS